MVKRTIAKVIGATSFQFYKTAYNIYNIDAGKYLLYGILTDQGDKYKLEDLSHKVKNLC